MLLELPEETQDLIYAGYLFKDFLRTHFKFFRLPSTASIWGTNQHYGGAFCENSCLRMRSYFNWKDEPYRDFMSSVLRQLHPRFEPEGHVLMEEMEESNDLFFVGSGTVGVGYEINKIRSFGLKYEDQCVIGAFNCTFYQRSNYIWKCLTPCEGFFIYKSDWIEIINSSDQLGRQLKQNILIDYVCKVRGRLEIAKNKSLKAILKRDLHQNLCMTKTKES
jgi:CRP-like cAMP-binding protein